MDQVDVDLRLLKAAPDKWDFEVTVRNVGSRAVFVMTGPRRVDNSKGPYVSWADLRPGILEVSIQVYPPPPYFFIANNAGVKLQELPAGASHKELLSVSLPIPETLPPYGDTPRRAKIDPKQVLMITAAVGILPDDEGIRDLLARKPFGPFVHGLEEVTKGASKGKRLFELQGVYYSPTIPVPQ